jgi:hypothetical protein
MLSNVVDDVRRSRLNTNERVVGNLLGILEFLQVDGFTSSPQPPYIAFGGGNQERDDALPLSP